MKTFDEVLAVWKALDACECGLDDFFASTRDGEVRVVLNCNDFFAWACSDCEPLEVADVPAYVQAHADCNAAKEYTGVSHGSNLWVCRKRGMRPQGACYKSIPKELRPLFDAAGPPRVAGLGNPVSRESLE